MTISNLMKMAESYLKRVGNTVGKGEIARYEQFLLFPQCFQKACFPGASKGVVSHHNFRLDPIDSMGRKNNELYG